MAWLLAAASCVTAALYLASTLWTAFWMTQFGDSLGVKAGEVFAMGVHPTERQRIVVVTGCSPTRQWSWNFGRRLVPIGWGVLPHGGFNANMSRGALAVPLLPPAVLLGGAALWAARRHRRRVRLRGNLCVRCGYDRTGLPAGADCPECGPHLKVMGREADGREALAASDPRSHPSPQRGDGL